MHNAYTHIYNKLVFEVLEERFGKEEACVFARSATAGGQRYVIGVSNPANIWLNNAQLQVPCGAYGISVRKDARLTVYWQHWGGDCESTWEAMAETLRGGLSLTLSGFGFTSHDIGGFEVKHNGLGCTLGLLTLTIRVILLQKYICAGLPLVCSLLIRDYMVQAAIAFLGTMASKHPRFSPSSSTPNIGLCHTFTLRCAQLIR